MLNKFQSITFQVISAEIYESNLKQLVTYSGQYTDYLLYYLG